MNTINDSEWKEQKRKAKFVDSLLDEFVRHGFSKVNITLDKDLLNVDIKGLSTVTFDLSQSVNIFTACTGCKITSVESEDSDTYKEFMTISRFIFNHKNDIRELFEIIENVSNDFTSFEESLLAEFYYHGFPRVSLNLWKDSILYANIKGLPTIRFYLDQSYSGNTLKIKTENYEKVPDDVFAKLLAVSRFIHIHEDEVRGLFENKKSISNKK